MTRLLNYAAQTRKALAALAGVIAQLTALGVLHGQQLHYAQVAAAVISAVLVHQVPNRTSAASSPDLGGVEFEPVIPAADPNTAGSSTPEAPAA